LDRERGGDRRGGAPGYAVDPLRRATPGWEARLQRDVLLVPVLRRSRVDPGATGGPHHRTSDGTRLSLRRAAFAGATDRHRVDHRHVPDAGPDFTWFLMEVATADARPMVGTRFSRAVALTGVVIGFVGILALGALALFNYNGWKRGRDRYPILAWLVAWLGIIAVAGISLTAVFFGPGRIDDFGGWGSVVMVVGS